MKLSLTSDKMIVLMELLPDTLYLLDKSILFVFIEYEDD